MNAVWRHMGIPVKEKMEGMVYLQNLKIWRTDPEKNDFKIEYLKLEEDSVLPKSMGEKPHIAYGVSDFNGCLNSAEKLLFGPIISSGGDRMAFIENDGVIFEIFEDSAPKSL